MFEAGEQRYALVGRRNNPSCLKSALSGFAFCPSFGVGGTRHYSLEILRGHGIVTLYSGHQSEGVG